MPKFDHRFDNGISERKDLRFTSMDEADDFAISRYRAHFNTQVILMHSDVTYSVHDHDDPQVGIMCSWEQDACIEVARISSMPGEG